MFNRRTDLVFAGVVVLLVGSFISRPRTTETECRGATEPERTSSAPRTQQALLIAPFDANEAEAGRRAWARSWKVDENQTGSVGIKLTLIPPGEFQMGSSKADIEKILRIDSAFKRRY